MPDGGAEFGDAVTVSILGDETSKLDAGAGSLDLDLDRSIAGGFFLAPA